MYPDLLFPPKICGRAATSTKGFPIPPSGSTTRSYSTAAGSSRLERTLWDRCRSILPPCAPPVCGKIAACAFHRCLEMCVFGMMNCTVGGFVRALACAAVKVARGSCVQCGSTDLSALEVAHVHQKRGCALPCCHQNILTQGLKNEVGSSNPIQTNRCMYRYKDSKLEERKLGRKKGIEGCAPFCA